MGLGSRLGLSAELGGPPPWGDRDFLSLQKTQVRFVTNPLRPRVTAKIINNPKDQALMLQSCGQSRSRGSREAQGSQSSQDRGGRASGSLRQIHAVWVEASGSHHQVSQLTLSAAPASTRCGPARSSSIEPKPAVCSFLSSLSPAWEVGRSGDLGS